MNRVDITVLFDGVLYYSNPLNTSLNFFHSLFHSRPTAGRE